MFDPRNDFKVGGTQEVAGIDVIDSETRAANRQRGYEACMANSRGVQNININRCVEFRQQR